MCLHPSIVEPAIIHTVDPDARSMLRESMTVLNNTGTWTFNSYEPVIGNPSDTCGYTRLCRYKHHETDQHRSSGMPVILRPDVRKQLLDDSPITTPLLCLGRKMNLFLRGFFPFFDRF